MKKKKKNKKKTGKMRETKRARVKNASPSAERRERLSLTLSLCVKLDHAQEISVSLLVHESPTTGFCFGFGGEGFLLLLLRDQKRETKTTGRQRKANERRGAALLSQNF